jgi:hypothetical protein
VTGRVTFNTGFGTLSTSSTSLLSSTSLPSHLPSLSLPPAAAAANNNNNNNNCGNNTNSSSNSNSGGSNSSNNDSTSDDDDARHLTEHRATPFNREG